MHSADMYVKSTYDKLTLIHTHSLARLGHAVNVSCTCRKNICAKYFKPHFDKGLAPKLQSLNRGGRGAAWAQANPSFLSIENHCANMTGIVILGHGPSLSTLASACCLNK